MKLDNVTLLSYHVNMKNRYAIPPAKLLNEIFEYKDGKLYWKYTLKFGAIKARQRAGYACPDGYRKVGIDKKSYMEHRIIWRMHHPRGRMPAFLDHIDGNRSNNKIENLRSVTISENQNNRHSNYKLKAKKDNKLFNYVV